jgi:hypothetical protein
MHELRFPLICAEGRPRAGDFPRLGNDAIQPLEKSASNPLICNERNFGACELQDFDACGGGEKRGPERLEWGLERAVESGTEVRRHPQKPLQTRRTPQ